MTDKTDIEEYQKKLERVLLDYDPGYYTNYTPEHSHFFGLFRGTNISVIEFITKLFPPGFETVSGGKKRGGGRRRDCQMGISNLAKFIDDVSSHETISKLIVCDRELRQRESWDRVNELDTAIKLSEGTISADLCDLVNEYHHDIVPREDVSATASNASYPSVSTSVSHQNENIKPFREGLGSISDQLMGMNSSATRHSNVLVATHVAVTILLYSPEFETRVNPYFARTVKNKIVQLFTRFDQFNCVQLTEEESELIRHVARVEIAKMMRMNRCSEKMPNETTSLAFNILKKVSESCDGNTIGSIAHSTKFRLYAYIEFLKK